MGDILIIGGGFGGIRAAHVLSRKRSRLGQRRILLVDAKKTSDFLPLLPDVVGGRVKKENACLDLEMNLARLGVNFEQDEVVKVDAQAREARLKSGGVLSYEFLVVACGSVTNFYGRADVQRASLKLDTAEEAALLAHVLGNSSDKNILIVGGGYTGIEVAGNIAAALRRRRIKNYSLHIIERAQDILGPLPEWMKIYCRINLSALRVDVHVDCSLKEMTDRTVTLSNGRTFEDYVLIWAAGVQTPAFVRDLPFDKDRQGRLLVDENLMFAPNSFAVGDAASFKTRAGTLRMAVQFTLAQGAVAAENILRLAAGKKVLKAYRPLDLGLLVPLANRKACGKVLFCRVWGILGWFFHYTMCIYRSLSLRNGWGVARDVFFRIR